MRKDRIWRVVAAVLALAVVPCFRGQQAPAVAPIELVRQAVKNEMNSASESPKYMFRERRQSPHALQTKLIVETRDCLAAVLVAVDDRPLRPDERKADDERLERFLKNPEELRKKQKQENDDQERVRRIIAALPEAFLYQSAGTGTGQAGVGRVGRELVRLKFSPNPRYEPPSRVEQVLTGMSGFMLLDPEAQRLAEIDGTLTKEVSFGWGILGHLDRGGHFLVDQADIDNGHWDITRMDLAFTGKVLFFKSIAFKAQQTYSDFHRVPSGLSFAEGLDLLRKQEGTLAENRN
jgi:hypothetical protein